MNKITENILKLQDIDQDFNELKSTGKANELIKLISTILLTTKISKENLKIICSHLIEEISGDLITSLNLSVIDNPRPDNLPQAKNRSLNHSQLSYTAANHSQLNYTAINNSDIQDQSTKLITSKACQRPPALQNQGLSNRSMGPKSLNNSQVSLLSPIIPEIIENNHSQYSGSISSSRLPTPNGFKSPQPSKSYRNTNKSKTNPNIKNGIVSIKFSSPTNEDFNKMQVKTLLCLDELYAMGK
ncbi:hypothetical protein SteCoe_24138 [Stentor coeruleus]|uniref:Uncharacterized protein n=1 Tax=Stentor coeruleus TaxID=5963 RepID=A0A1R2BI69_9CILI|nr:hypothetical protein SteCoe_24138 [Stentor coeruleus]